MILGIYAVHDAKVGYMIPSFQQNDALAARNFELDCEAPEAAPIRKHPEDFRLYNIGSYNTETGELKSVTPTVIADPKADLEWKE